MAPRMRTIDQSIAWLRENDPDCAFTKTALRQLIVTGQFPCVHIGNKYLIDLDVLIDFLHGSLPEAVSAVSGDRRVEA